MSLTDDVSVGFVYSEGGEKNNIIVEKINISNIIKTRLQVEISKLKVGFLYFYYFA